MTSDDGQTWWWDGGRTQLVALTCRGWREDVYDGPLRM